MTNILSPAGSFAQRIRAGATGKQAVSMGLATEADLEEMAKAWEEWASAEDACFGELSSALLPAFTR